MRIIDRHYSDIVNSLLDSIGHKTEPGKIYEVHRGATEVQLQSVANINGRHIAVDVTGLDDKEFQSWLEGGETWIRDNGQLILAMCGLSEILLITINKLDGRLSLVGIKEDRDAQMRAFTTVFKAITEEQAPPKEQRLPLDCSAVYRMTGGPCRVSCRNCYHVLYDPAKGWNCTNMHPVQLIPENVLKGEGCKRHLFAPELLPFPFEIASEAGILYKLENLELWNVPDEDKDHGANCFTSTELSKLADGVALAADPSLIKLREMFEASPTG